MGERVQLHWHTVHFHKIIHRDIKPANLLLSEEGRIKVGDELGFGLKGGRVGCGLVGGWVSKRVGGWMGW